MSRVPSHAAYPAQHPYPQHPQHPPPLPSPGGNYYSHPSHQPHGYPVHPSHQPQSQAHPSSSSAYPQTAAGAYDGYRYRQDEQWSSPGGPGPSSAHGVTQAHGYGQHSGSRHSGHTYDYSQVAPPTTAVGGPMSATSVLPPPVPTHPSGQQTSPQHAQFPTTSGRPNSSSTQPRQPPGSSGWTSIHPSQHQPPPPRPATASGVKLEDLVSSDKASGGARGAGMTSAPLKNGAAGASTADGRPASGNLAAEIPNPAPTSQPGPSEFIKKLYKMLEEESLQFGNGEPPGKPRGKGAKRGSVGWGRGGTTFVVWDMNDFTTKILPQTFRHSNFSSFVRQLNKYGFSKIKHVDEDTGQLKENIWEFQHPDFQAGGKANLDSIKRKVVATKKADNDDPGSPSRGNITLGSDETLRVMEMEHRMRGLEDHLIRTMEELREARSREVGMMGLVRELIGSIGQMERDNSSNKSDINTPHSDGGPSNRTVYLYQMLDQLTGSMHSGHGYPHPPPAGYASAPGVPSYAQPHPYAPSHGQPYPPHPGQSHTAPAGYSAYSARTSDGSASREDSSPASAPPPAAGRPGKVAQGNYYDGQAGRDPHAGRPAAQSGMSVLAPPISSIDPPHAAPVPRENLPAPAASQSQAPQPQPPLQQPNQAEPSFADTGAWLTDNTMMTMPMYHRKSSDGLTLKLMMEALAQHSQSVNGPVNDANGTGRQGAVGTDGNGMFTESQDPLDTTPRSDDPPSRHSAAQGLTNKFPIVQSSPFGTLLIPAESGMHPGNSNSDDTYPQGTTASITNMEAEIDNTTSIQNGHGEGQAAGAAQPGQSYPKQAQSSRSDPQTFAARPTTDANGNAVRLRRSTVIKPSWNKTPRILVVEDDVVYRQLSSKFLEKFGCIVETVVNAQEAIERMNSTKFDLVLMDIFFGPSMDGRKATSLIRQFDMYTPIISMTSNAQPQDVDSYYQSGMNDILAKPFTKNGLFGILDKHLIHLKAIQLSGEVPRSVGVPPLSDQGVLDALNSSANMQVDWVNGIAGPDDGGRNPLAAMGWSDDTYQIILSQFLQNGVIPDVSQVHFDPTSVQAIGPSQANGAAVNGPVQAQAHGGAIGTNLVFGNNANRKRSLELMDEDWSPTPGTTGVGESPVLPSGGQVQTVPVPLPPAKGQAEVKKETKKARKA